MAPKYPSDPPTASSPEEEMEEISSSESDPDSSTNTEPQSSSSEYGSASDGGDSDPTPGRASEPREVQKSRATTKPGSKPASSAAGSSAAGTKRKATEVDGKTSFERARKEKGLKPSAEGVVSPVDSNKSAVGEKKKLFERIWSDEDEIVILKGMLDFTKRGADPVADASAFYQSVKNSLRADGSKAQVMSKIQRLKKKFKNIFKRARNGMEPSFSKPHAKEVYVLSKKLWGSTEEPSGTKKMEIDEKKGSGSGSVSERCLNGMLRICKSTGMAGLEESMMKKALELIGDEKKALLDERWIDVEMSELALFVKQTELVRDQARLMLEAYSSRTQKFQESGSRSNNSEQTSTDKEKKDEQTELSFKLWKASGLDVTLSTLSRTARKEIKTGDTSLVKIKEKVLCSMSKEEGMVEGGKRTAPDQEAIRGEAKGESKSRWKLLSEGRAQASSPAGRGLPHEMRKRQKIEGSGSSKEGFLQTHIIILSSSSDSDDDQDVLGSN